MNISVGTSSKITRQLSDGSFQSCEFQINLSLGDTEKLDDLKVLDIRAKAAKLQYEAKASTLKGFLKEGLISMEELQRQLKPFTDDVNIAEQRLKALQERQSQQPSG